MSYEEYDPDGMVELDWRPRMAKKRKQELIEPDVYVVTINHENNGEVTVFRGELVETNLVEITNKVSSYKLMDKLPNWLEAAFNLKASPRPPREPRSRA